MYFAIAPFGESMAPKCENDSPRMISSTELKIVGFSCEKSNFKDGFYGTQLRNTVRKARYSYNDDHWQELGVSRAVTATNRFDFIFRDHWGNAAIAKRIAESAGRND